MSGHALGGELFDGFPGPEKLLDQAGASECEGFDELFLTWSRRSDCRVFDSKRPLPLPIAERFSARRIHLLAIRRSPFHIFRRELSVLRFPAGAVRAKTRTTRVRLRRES